MVTVVAQRVTSETGAFGATSLAAGTANLCTGQTGNGVTTNVLDRGGNVGPVALVITTTVGATPTCTYAIEGSADGVSFFNIQYADQGSPQTLVITTFTITTATTVTKLIPSNIPVRYIRVTMSANTNVTSTADCYIF